MTSPGRGPYVTRPLLEILSAAVALQEFTLSELSAYAPVHLSTVYYVLHRVNDKHDWFIVRAISQHGATADLWCLREDCREVVLAEIARMEEHIRTRRYKGRARKR